MVLEKLGTSLRDTLHKISKAVFVDEKLVNELVKDIQRALLQSDVNVKMVFELSKKIKERLMNDDAPPGLTKKEFLIKIVYEELVNFLGAEASTIEITKKPTKIMMVGLFGHGKCVHKDSNILLFDGTTVGVQQLYDSYRCNGEVDIEDGCIIPLDAELSVPSMNTKSLKIEKKRVTHLWKLKSKDLMAVSLDMGNDFNVKTTCEHPFFVLKDGLVEQRRADELRRGDYVAIPAKVTTESGSINFEDSLKRLNLNVKISDDKTLRTLKKKIIAEHGTLMRAAYSLPHKRNYAVFTSSLKKGEIPIQLCGLGTSDAVHLKLQNSQDYIDFPTRSTPEMAEFLGYIIGDGHLSHNSVNISNKDPEIIERLKTLSKDLFGRELKLTPCKRSKGLYDLRINSKTLVTLIHGLFGIPIGKKGTGLEVPQLVQLSSQDVISRFLRAYFDCDGYFCRTQRQIEAVSESRVLLRQIQHMLLRFGIVAKMINKRTDGKDYSRLMVQARDTVIFGERIGASIARKREALENHVIMTIKQGDGKKDMIPVGSLLRELREMSGFSLSQIQDAVSSYGLYEKKGMISRTQLRNVVCFYERGESGNFRKLIGLVENSQKDKLSEQLRISQPLVNALVGELRNRNMIAEVTNSPTRLVLTEKGSKYFDGMKRSSDRLFGILRTLAYADVCWAKVKDVSKVKNDHPYVYDLTVEDSHNFIADGIVVHNTTTAAKLAKYYQKRGNKLALISTDTWRPAAFEQLRQLGAQINVPVFGNPKAKSPVAIYKEFEDKLGEFDLVIIDTAGRDALSDELIRELNDINNAVQADEKLLVIGGDVGQAAERQAQTFHDTCNVTGVIITKLEGTAKGGGALIACSVTGAKVKFIVVGEKIDDLEVYSPERFVGKMLGMGDLEGLLEKAREAITEEDAQDLGKKLLKGDFNLLDLYEQMQAMKKMGPLGKVMDM
ncbi:MAG: LAGLIDADG family homing endonuclease, partial [Candidatus Woesearchaeota archaeon]